MQSHQRGDAALKGRARFHVLHGAEPVRGASCSLYVAPPDEGETLCDDRYVATAVSDHRGRGEFEGLAPGSYVLVLQHKPQGEPIEIEVEAGHDTDVTLAFGLDLKVTVRLCGDGGQAPDCGIARPGDIVELTVAHTDSDNSGITYVFPPGARIDRNDPRIAHWVVPGPGTHELDVSALSPYVAEPGAPRHGSAARVTDSSFIDVVQRPVQPVSGSVDVNMGRAATVPTADLTFWQGILNSTEQMGFNNYQRYMNMLFCGETDLCDVPPFERERLAMKGRLYREALRAGGVLGEPRPFDERRDRAYLARRDLPAPREGIEEAFANDYLVRLLGGREGDRTLPYLAVIRSKLPELPLNLGPLQADPGAVGRLQGVLQDRFTNPCMLELSWSYWIEEGALVQTMNSIARRFQNIGSGPRDPLVNLEIDPLRPLSNLLWGFVQEEQHRLSMARRSFEYCHEYGLSLQGRAVPRLPAADCRTEFLEAFHHLVRLCANFYRQDDDTTVKADAFPVLNALKEVHLVLSQGASNQYGDIVSTARVEMLLQQWILARPEFREFLPTRVMTALPEAWMDRVDAMKKLKGWSDTSVLHFRNLAVFSEQVLLSIRWGHWSDVQEPLQAFNWARFFRPQIQGYIHAYRAATGVDLAAGEGARPADALPPSVLMQRRMEMRRNAA